MKVTNSANEVAIWQEIRGAWYASKEFWKKYLPFFNVREVDIVEVRLWPLQAEFVLTDHLRFPSQDKN